MQLSALQLRELPVFEPERLAKQSRALRDTVAGDRVFFGLVLVEDSAHRSQFARMNMAMERWHKHELVWQNAAHRGPRFRWRSSAGETGAPDASISGVSFARFVF
jgi:hypothetical protein